MSEKDDVVGRLPRRLLGKLAAILSELTNEEVLEIMSMLEDTEKLAVLISEEETNDE